MRLIRIRHHRTGCVPEFSLKSGSLYGSLHRAWMCLHAGLNESIDEGDHEQELDTSLKVSRTVWCQSNSAPNVTTLQQHCQEERLAMV